MTKSHIVKSVNMSAGEVLTLEKAGERMEFEALPLFSLDASGDCTFDCSCKNGTNCGTNNN
ncbi:MAG: hypothetical protein WCU88_08825 [Elusimicrobiota bacterium]|jgi:hypothetical protein